MRISPHAWPSAFKRHAIVKRLTVGVAADIAQCDSDDAALGDLKMVAARHMWRDEAFRLAPQRRVGRQRLRFGHVERGTTDSSFRERVSKCLAFNGVAGVDGTHMAITSAYCRTSSRESKPII